MEVAFTPEIALTEFLTILVNATNFPLFIFLFSFLFIFFFCRRSLFSHNKEQVPRKYIRCDYFVVTR